MMKKNSNNVINSIPYWMGGERERGRERNMPVCAGMSHYHKKQRTILKTL